MGPHGPFTLLTLTALLGCGTPSGTGVVPQDATFAGPGNVLLQSPFGQASGAGVGIATLNEGERVAPNLHFDMEAPFEAGVEGRTSDQARSGSWSFRMDAGREYGPRVDRTVVQVARDLQAVQVECWVLSQDEDPRLTIVISIARGEEQISWSGKDLQAHEHRPGEWERFNAEYLLRDLQVLPGDVVSVLLWKRSAAEIFVDDLSISYLSRDIPGREASPSAGTRRFPYASVHCSDPQWNVPPPGSLLPERPERVSAVPLTEGDSLQVRFLPGVCLVVSPKGDTLALARLHCAGAGDLLLYEHLEAEPLSKGLRIRAFDLDRQDSAWAISHDPPPVTATFIFELPE